MFRELTRVKDWIFALGIPMYCFELLRILHQCRLLENLQQWKLKDKITITIFPNVDDSLQPPAQIAACVLETFYHAFLGI